jgi:protein gp37
MSDNSRIEWTDATWNPTAGCTKVSPGCDHCYAERLHERFHGPGSFAAVTTRPDRIPLPLSWRKPRRVFVNSMSDLFHDAVPDAFIAETFAVMALAYRHTFQVLTKRHARMRALLASPRFPTLMLRAALTDPRFERCMDIDQRIRQALAWPLPNVWLGVSAETQQWANIRIPFLLDTPAAVRWVSAEPLLGPLDLGPFLRRPLGLDRLDWVVAGGESGPGARAMLPAWPRALRDQCQAAGVAFFFKQWGEWAPTGYEGVSAVSRLNERPPRFYAPNPDAPDDPYALGPEMARVGKKAAGRILDGRTHDAYPDPPLHPAHPARPAHPAHRPRGAA